MKSKKKYHFLFSFFLLYLQLGAVVMAQTITESLSLRFQGRYMQEVDVVLENNGEELKALYLNQLPLEKMFNHELAKELRALTAPATLIDCTRLGLIIRYNSNELMVDVHVDKKMTSATFISLNPIPLKSPHKEKNGPAPLSMLANMRPLYHYGERESLEADMDFSLRMKDIVFLTDWDWRSEKARRQDTRLVYDIPSHSLRTSIGDVNAVASEVLVPVNVGGISINTDFSMTPNGRPLPSPQSTLILERRSRVNIYGREQLLQSLTLAPGKYRFGDFQFTNGIGQMRFEIQEEGGRQYSIIVPYAIDERQLAPGKQELSYSIGKEYIDDVDKRRYQTQNNPVTTIQHRFGFNQFTTFGAHTQFDNDHQVFGLESLLVGTMGSLKNDLTFSDHESGQGIRPGLGYLLRYFSDVQLSADYSYESPSFARWSQTPTNTSHVGSLGVVMRPGDWWSIGLKSTYSWQRQEDLLRRFEMNLNGRPSSGLNLTATLRRAELSDRSWESALSLYLSYFFDDQKHAVDIGYNSPNGFKSSQDDLLTMGARGNYQQGDWQILPQVNVEKNNQQASSGEQKNYRAHLDTRHPRFDFTFDQRHDGQTDAGQIGVGFALAYVDGHVGIGRPSPGAYALVWGAGQTVSGGGLSTPTTIGKVPLLLTGLRGYDQLSVQLEKEPSVEGLISEYSTFQTAFFSGHLIKSSSAKWRGLKFTLHNKDKSIAGLVLVKARHYISKQEVEFFTNKEGKSLLEIRESGRWEIFWGKESTWLNVSDKSGIIELGNIYAQ